MKRKTLRSITGLLCAALVFSNMAGMSAFAMEEGGAGQKAQVQEQESVSGNDAGEDDGEKTEEAEEPEALEYPEEPEIEATDSGTEPEITIPEEAAATNDGDQENGGQKTEETGETAPEGSAGETPEGEAAGTVSENTVEEENCGEAVPARESFFPQAYSSGKSFTVDDKTYNSADADETYTAGDNITAYYFEADSLLYFDGSGPMQDWLQHIYRPWYRIEPEKCVIGEGITTVGTYAFDWPTHSMKSVSLPSTLQAVNDFGFYQCSDIETLILPDGLERIGEQAFLGCKSLTSIDIPDSVTDLGDRAFYECTSAASIHVPGSVREVKSMTFSACRAARAITIDEGVESIGEAAFQGSAVTELTLPGSIKTIGDFAFNNSKSLHTLKIPDSVTGIGKKAFASCNALLRIHIGTGVASIGTNAFVVAGEKKFRLDSENETAWAYDWAADNRVIAYQITFKNADGSVLNSDFVPMGEKILTYAPLLEGHFTETETFTFTGWEPELTEDMVVAGDAEYTARYTSVERLYTLTFLDYDGTTLKEVQKPYGTVIAGEAPTPERAAEGEHTYTFAGWQPALDEGDTLTGDAAYEAVYTSGLKQCRVVFQNHDGSVLKSFSVPYGETVSGRAPAASRQREGLNTYSFAGWQPALDTAAPIRGDITYTALYTRKTQTGISVGHELNHPSESRISAADIRVYPVYEIYDPSGRFQEKVTDRDHPVEEPDLSLSDSSLKKGDNEISVEQTSTGCTARFHIYGSFIDGIYAVPVDAQVKAGSKVSRFTVYFTRNRMESGGEILRGVVDRTAKVNRYTLNNGASSVTVLEGDNEIRITEKETGENHFCVVHITGTGKDGGSGPKEDDGKPEDGGSHGKSEKDPNGKQDTEPSPEPDIRRIVLDVPKKEENLSDLCRIQVVWDPAGEERAVPEETDTFEEILLQTKQAQETEKTEAVPPAVREPEKVQEKEAATVQEQDGAGEKAVEEKPRQEKPSLWMLPAAFAVLGIAALAVLRGRRRQQKFHGILTWEENPAIEINNPKECLETVQEVIDRTENLADCRKELKKSGARTYLPASAGMEVRYTDEDGEVQVIEEGASEKKMVHILSSICGSEKADVRIFHEQTGIDIKLTYKL